MAQLAALEWAILDAFDAPDARAPGPGRLAGNATGASWPELRFELTPSLQRLHVDWRVDELWRARTTRPNRCRAEPPHEATWLRVWRQDLRVFHRPIEPAEVACAAAIAGGEPLALVCEHIAAVVPDGAAERAADMLGQWMAEGVLMRPAAAPAAARGHESR